MADLTVIYLTLNRMPEDFAERQRSLLAGAIGDKPLISISRKPIDFGYNLLDTDEPGYKNIYRQLLRGCKEAETKYIAVAEDDCLYPKEHFDFYRPTDDTFAYNQNRFALFMWGEPMYNWRNRKSNCTLIAPRELAIEALEERFKVPHWPEGFIGELGRELVERGLGVTVRKSVEVFSNVSVIQINHQLALEDRQRRKRKSYGPIRAYDIPYWGKADEVRKEWTVEPI